MKAIIIEEKDCKCLLQRLELCKYMNSTGRSHLQAEQLADVAKVHKWFHYIVTCWLQEQGADRLKW
jgi:hypothetical protein